MSLRDYFAAAALQGPLASRGHIVKQDGSPITTPWEYAHAAYSFADAMLAARARRDGEGKGQP
jgi:hypothetical protein